MPFSADRILTVKEMKIGDKIHSGFTGGFCVKWTVVSKSEFKAFLQHKNGSVCNVDGIQLRKLATYHADNCPLCEYQSPIDVNSPEVKFLRQDLPQPILQSAFRFKEAQLTMRRRNAR